MKRGVHLVLIALLAVGCGTPKDTPAASASAPKPASALTPVSMETFSIEIPKEWKVIDFASKGLNEALDGMAKDDPALATMIPTLKQMGATGQFKLFAFDLANTEDGFTDNLNVIVQDSPGIKLDELVKLNADQLKTMADRDSVKVSRVKGASGELGLIRWSQTTKAKTQFHTVLGVTATKVYTFTYTCLDKHADAFAAKASQSIATIQLK